MYFNGEWGTFSGDAADASDALVACRQLGYDTRCEFGHSFNIHDEEHMCM